MPYINLKTNVKITDTTCEELKSGFGQAITDIPGKTERWLMVDIEDQKRMFFDGSADPTVMVEVSVFGQASDSDLEVLTKDITDLVSSKTSVSSDRIYVKYESTNQWGWNGTNF